MRRSIPVRAALFLAACVLVAGAAHPQAAEQTLEAWRGTLRFGIDSEVVDLLQRLRDEGERRLDADLVRRFTVSRTTALKVSLLEYFTAVDSDLLGAEVLRLLMDEETADPLLRPSITYLSRTVGERAPPLVDRYAEIARRRDQLTASAAIDGLGRHGTPESVMALLDLHAELKSPELRSAILRALGEAGDPAARELLTAVALDEFNDASLRHYATESLGRLGLPESLEVLSSLLDSGDAILRAYAVQAVGRYDGEYAAAVLVDSLLDSFWRTRVAALQALTDRPRPEALEAVTYKARRDPERPVREQAIRALAALAGSEALGVLEEIALDERTAVAERGLALQRLVAVQGPQSVPTIERVLLAEWDREGSRLLDAAGRLLSEQEDPAFLGITARLLEHRSPIIQVYGIRGLGRIGAPEYVERLKAIASGSPTGLVKTSALLALDRMGVEWDPDKPAGE